MRAVATKSIEKARRVEAEYLRLVRQFPLRPLATSREFERAGEILDHYVGRADLISGERDYVAALVRFVEDFEQSHEKTALAKLGPLGLLKHLMEENEMNQTDLGYILGSRRLASEVLNGKRGLSKTLIRKLAEKFQVDPTLFFDQSHE
jgi:HTH-type transcriptional regulator/antitoxin HigA